MRLKHLFAGAFAAFVALLTPTISQADATFQGVTFIFTPVDADTITFELKGTPTGDWSTAQFLAAFDLKDLGINFGNPPPGPISTGTAFGPGCPITGCVGLNSQLSASSVDCLAAGSPPNSICFDISPDTPVTPYPFDLVYTINFSLPYTFGTGLDQNGNTVTGPHLQIAFSETENGPKVGSLYSFNVTTSSGSSSGSSGRLPEPNSGLLALLGVAMLGSVMWLRRRRFDR